MSKINKLREEAQKVSEQIVKAYQPEKVVLFGSLSNGVKKQADIDLLVWKQPSPFSSESPRRGGD